MHLFLEAIHVAACALLIVIVLLQAGRGAGLAIFGGGGDAMFASPTGSSALKKATVVLASTFAITSLMLTLLSSRSEMRTVTGKRPAIPSGPLKPTGGPNAPAPPPRAPAQPAPKAPKAPAQPAGK